MGNLAYQNEFGQQNAEIGQKIVALTLECCYMIVTIIDIFKIQ